MLLGQLHNLGITSASCISHESDCIHLVLDSYIEMSLKEGERTRRTDPTTGINIVGMTRDTPIPQQLDKFWSSQENKQNLQLLVRDTVCNGHNANTTIIASSVVSDDEVLPAKANGGAEIPELLNCTEEADSRLVLHVELAVRVKQCQRVVVLSNDTDTFVLVLHYAPYLQTQELKELWQQYGTGKKRRMLPLHQAVSQLGAPLAMTVICLIFSPRGRLHVAMGRPLSSRATHFDFMPCLPPSCTLSCSLILSNHLFLGLPFYSFLAIAFLTSSWWYPPLPSSTRGHTIAVVSS